MDNFSEFMQDLEMRVYDEPHLDQLKARFPNFVSLCEYVVDTTRTRLSMPLPPTSEMTGIQATIFDNWPDGSPAKNHPNRYGMAIEVWTAPADKIQTHRKGDYQFKANAALVDAKGMKSKLKRLANKSMSSPISSEFAEAINLMVSNMGPDDLIGLIQTKSRGEGSTYRNGQFVYLPGGIQGFDTVVYLSTDDGRNQLLLNKFTDMKPKGNAKLGGPAYLQSRCDIVGFSEKWATGEWE
jgi:hypothetical protein